MRKIICFGLLAVGLLTGCTTSLMDARTPSEICEIHHTFMRTDELPGQKEINPPSEEYIRARLKGFVHSYPYYLPYRTRTKFVVYICDDCVQAEQAWKHQHPKQH